MLAEVLDQMPFWVDFGVQENSRKWLKNLWVAVDTLPRQDAFLPPV
jgi:hypothetical protein